MRKVSTSISLDAELLRQIAKLADEDHRSVSAMMELLLKYAIKSFENKGLIAKGGNTP